MSSKTRIIVLHMKEIIYTAVFLALAVVLAVVLFFMFGPGKNARRLMTISQSFEWHLMLFKI